MPTPLEILIDPITLSLMALWGVLLTLELCFPGATQPNIQNWRLKGALSLITYILLSSYLPFVTDSWLASYRLLDLTPLGTWKGAVAAILF